MLHATQNSGNPPSSNQTRMNNKEYLINEQSAFLFNKPIERIKTLVTLMGNLKKVRKWKSTIQIKWANHSNNLRKQFKQSGSIISIKPIRPVDSIH